MVPRASRPSSSRPPASRRVRFARSRSRGFSLVEMLLGMAVILVIATAGLTHVVRTTQHADWTQDRVFARQKAVSILAELRAFVEGEGRGRRRPGRLRRRRGVTSPRLTIAPDPTTPGALVPPGHAAVREHARTAGCGGGAAQITVRPFPGVDARDLRMCTVRVFRSGRAMPLPGEEMAEVSSVIRTVGDAYPTTQVYDVYLLALENVPGWWVNMDAIQPFVEATLTRPRVAQPRPPVPDALDHASWLRARRGVRAVHERGPRSTRRHAVDLRLPRAACPPARRPSGTTWPTRLGRG